jgi:hypothetical protein
MTNFRHLERHIFKFAGTCNLLSKNSKDKLAVLSYSLNLNTHVLAEFKVSRDSSKDAHMIAFLRNLLK